MTSKTKNKKKNMRRTTGAIKNVAPKLNAILVGRQLTYVIPRCPELQDFGSRERNTVNDEFRRNPAAVPDYSGHISNIYKFY